jgi:hypothetical protein
MTVNMNRNGREEVSKVAFAYEIVKRIEEKVERRVDSREEKRR